MGADPNGEVPVMDAVFAVPEPVNEPVLTYAPGSPERASLQRRLGELAGERVELTMTIDGAQRMATGDVVDVVQPHRHRQVLGVTRNATTSDAASAQSSCGPRT
jgi:1-pyrroline-5-carboxylate dehydrogenase